MYHMQLLVEHLVLLAIKNRRNKYKYTRLDSSKTSESSNAHLHIHDPST